MGLFVTRSEVKPGDYFCSARDLYRVEHVAAGHVVVEDCRNGELVDVPLGQLLKLTRVHSGEAAA